MRSKTIVFTRNLSKPMAMNVIKTDIEGVVILEPRVYADERGYF